MASVEGMPGETNRKFTMTVLGRTLEHLGVQMYKRRDVAIAELVANCWDAGARNVYVTVPEACEYDPASSEIIIMDDGLGMNDDQVQHEYLVVGRNRRRAGSNQAGTRRVMGRKGIGKLAGFGIASKMTLLTWRDGQSTRLTLDVEDLKREDGETAEIPIDGVIGPPPENARSAAGTSLILRDLKHKTPLDVGSLREALGRRFSRTVLGEMQIWVNGQPLAEPTLDMEETVPAESDKEYDEDELADGPKVKYRYGFSKTPIRSPQMRGFTVYVRGKTAQAPPFFFNVEGTASGQHGTRYVTGAIVADFLDEGTDDESDVISTDRQEIDWEDERVHPFYEWGQELARRVLREWATRKGDQIENAVLANQALRARMERLDDPSRQQALSLLRELGKADTDPDRAIPLADALIRAYEYRHFHDVIQQIEAAGGDPEQLEQLLEHLGTWQVMESRAILEIIKGRLGIIEKFHSMIVNNAPETAHTVGADNMHDLLAGSPWLLNPDWQVLAEERRISTQLREWNADDIQGEDERLRYDFLALTGDLGLVIVEIKRAGHAVTLEELQRLEKYKERLTTARDSVHMVLVYGGALSVSEDVRRNWERREDGDLLRWSDIHERTSRFYEHYRAVLEHDIEHGDFARRQQEVSKTRQILQAGSVWRGPEERVADRADRFGTQDVDYTSGSATPDEERRR